MEVWGVYEGVAEDHKIRYIASSKEKAERIAYLENYLYDDEHAYAVKLSVDRYDEKMPPFVVFGGYIGFTAEQDENGKSPDFFYVHKYEPDEPGFSRMEGVGLSFEKPISTHDNWRRTFLHKYPFTGCVVTIDGESPENLMKRIKEFVFEEFCAKRKELQNELFMTAWED